MRSRRCSFAATCTTPAVGGGPGAEEGLGKAPPRARAAPTDPVPIDADPAAASEPRAGQYRRPKRDVNGWLVLDKPVGMTSTHAVSVVKRLFAAKRAGHAGTLDPLASGCLPLALGEATQTVPVVVGGRQAHHFTVRWGGERDTQR